MSLLRFFLGFISVYFWVSSSWATGGGGGGWVSGGEDGVACFPSVVMKEKFTDPHGRLMPKGVSRLQSVQSLDLYEKSELGKPVSVHAPLFKELGAKSDEPNRALIKQQSDALRGAIDHLRVHHLSWRFHQLLDKLNKENPLEKWEIKNERIDDIDDTGVAPQLPSNCLLVQLAIRHSRWQQGRLETRVAIDWPLWNQLEPIHKVSVVLHEYLYVLTSTLEHRDSARTRKLTALLLSEALASEISTAYLEHGADFSRTRKWFHTKLSELEIDEYRRIVLDSSADAVHQQRLATMNSIREKLIKAGSDHPGDKRGSQLKRVEFLVEKLSSEETLLFFIIVWKAKSQEVLGEIRGKINFLALAQEYASVKTLDRFVADGKDSMFMSFESECRGAQEYFWEHVGFEDPSEEKNPFKRASRTLLDRALSFCQPYLPSDQ